MARTAPRFLDRPLKLCACLMGLVTAIAAAAAAPPDKSDILTPAPPASPRINGPALFGVRPGSPVIYRIPATGERPMAFAIDGLPEGLSVDPASGQISGVLKQAGEYPLTLRAKNAQGAAERKFRIVAGEKIALTPPMGWNSWNCWGDAVSADKVLRSARAMAASGLTEHGWTYINIDDAWQGRRGGAFNAIQGNERFPDMKGLCQEIHKLGLKVGIYSTPWMQSYAGYIGGTADNPEGQWSRSPKPKKGNLNKKIAPWAIGKHSFAASDARQWAEWGIDYLKYDWNPIEPPETEEMAKALRECGRDVVFSLSNSAPHAGAADWARLANAWRTTGDIRDTWSSVTRIWSQQDQWAPFAGPGHWNDPDMLVVGQVGWGKPRPTQLTADEQYTHISLWCLLAAPLLLGCDMEKLDPFTLSLLTNDEVLAVDQDAAGKQGVCVAREGSLEVYSKDLEDGSRAVGLFNRGDRPATITAKWADLKLTGRQTVRDLWRQKDLGVFDSEFQSKVPQHGVVLVRISAEK